MKPLYRQYLQRLLPYLLTGGILAIFYLVWLQNESPVQGLGLLFIIFYLWVFFSLASYFVWKFFLAPRLAPYSTRWKAFWLLGCLLTGYWLADNLPVVLPGSGAVKLLFFLCAGVGLALLLFTLSLFFVTRFRPPNPPLERCFRWWVFAVPMIITWFVYLLAFWPGMMSADSLDQWGQVLSGRYIDHHPAFHTFTIWLLTRIAATPAIVALAQIAALALVVGTILAYLESIGVAPIWLWGASLLFAISPVNGTMVNTLWKDIPYSTAMLGFSYLIFRLAYSKGAWIAGKGKWVVLGVTAALAALFRQNGLSVVAVTFPLLLVGFRRQWKPLAFAFALSLVLYYGITGPVYRLARVEKSSMLVDAATSLYGIAASADPGSQAEFFLQSMNPISNEWTCYVGPSLQQAELEDGAGHVESLPEKALNLIKYTPSLLSYDYRCNRSLVWIVWDPNGEVRNPSHAEYGIDPNSFGITPDSKIPALQTAVKNFVAQTAHEPGINWYVWRPALYLYLFLLVIAIAAMRRKNAWILFAAAPVLLQSIGITLITMPPNFRYHYLIYILALTFWPVIFIPSDCSTSAPSSSTSV